MTNGGPLAEMLIDRSSIRTRIEELAAELDEAFAGSSEPLFVSILKGSTLFMADLVRAMESSVTVVTTTSAATKEMTSYLAVPAMTA